MKLLWLITFIPFILNAQIIQRPFTTVAAAGDTLGTEILVNGNCETAATGWESDGFLATSERSSEQAHGGTYSWKNNGDAGRGTRQEVAVETGETYYLDFWVYQIADACVKVKIGGSTMGDCNDWSVPAATWTRVVIQYDASTTGNIYIEIQGLTDDPYTLYFDDASFKRLL